MMATFLRCEAPHPDPERAETCERPEGHVGQHGGMGASWPKITEPVPQFKPGDRVTLEGTVIDERDGRAAAQFIPVRLIGTQSSFPVMVLAERLTLVPVIFCATRFPGREDAPEAYCRRDPGHEGLHEDAEGWRWGTIEQRTDDAHAPAEPRCTDVGPYSRCWGMAGHIGPHRSPSGE